MSQPVTKRSSVHDVVYVRHQGRYDELEPTMAELASWCKAHGVSPGPYIIIYHDEPHDFGIGLTWPESPPDKCRSWVCVEVSGEVHKDDRVNLLAMRPVTVASMVYQGPKTKLVLRSVYRDLGEYVRRNDLTVGGPLRGIFENRSTGRGPEGKIAAEFQVPVYDLPGP